MRIRIFNMYLIVLFLEVSTGTLIDSSCQAQIYLNNKNVRVARHDKRNTSVKFVTKQDGINDAGLLYQKDIFEPMGYDDANLMHYEVLPQCEKAQHRLVQIPFNTSGSDKFDVLYYSPGTNAAKKAKNYKSRKVAYDPALLKDPLTGHIDYWQQFARFIRVKCLPTRYRFVTIDGKRYRELRNR